MAVHKPGCLDGCASLGALAVGGDTPVVRTCLVRVLVTATWAYEEHRLTLSSRIKIQYFELSALRQFDLEHGSCQHCYMPSYVEVRCWQGLPEGFFEKSSC